MQIVNTWLRSLFTLAVVLVSRGAIGQCSPDTTPPVVTAPGAISVPHSVCSGAQEGATGASAAALAAFLVGGSASDFCDAAPVRLAAQVAGVDASDSTFFPLGTTSVTFRWQDASGNIGVASSNVTVVLFFADLNEDGTVNAGDAVILANFLVGNIAAGAPPFSAPPGAADVNEDTSVNSVDAVLLANFLVGNVPCLPTGTVASTTWYVRPDGGSETQCSGLVNVPYPGSGTAQPCAWDHPFRALPPGGTPRIGGGHTLIVGAGSYRMGVGAPGSGNCDAAGAWDCHMPPLPSGPSIANPTRILGAGWDSGCTARPELWGAERANMILNLTGSSNVEIACLEITDHSSCVEFHSGAIPCERNTPPYGDWAGIGLAASDSASVLLSDLDIHGLAHTGVWAGRLTDWTLQDVRIAANGWVGWDGDIGAATSSNSGTLLFQRLTIEWNGCGETWPGEAPTGCWAQLAGGYGDGLGTAATAGLWIFEDSAFLHNTSDGLDLLYAQPAASIEIYRTIAEGNAGNQIKTSGTARIENSIVVGNCGYFDGQSFTYWVDDCRAVGNAVSLSLFRGDQVTVVNSTLTSEGDCLVLGNCDSLDGACDGSETILLRNEIFQGQVDFLQPFENTCLAYEETFPTNPFVIEYSIITGAKGDPCPGATNICGVPPGIVNTGIDAFDAHLVAGSPAIDAGTPTGAPADDFNANPRTPPPDIGAYELGSTP